MRWEKNLREKKSVWGVGRLRRSKEKEENVLVKVYIIKLMELINNEGI